MKLGQDYPVFACVLRDIIITRLKDNINHIYPILFQTFYEKWFFSFSHLKLLINNLFPYVRIIINNHIIQYYYFKVLFNKAKIYYNKKNYIYNLKSEVVIFVTPSFYCIFVSDHMSSFVYDFKIMKRKYYCYFEY
jgi:hypothetical protein